MSSRIKLFTAVLVFSLLFVLTGCDGGAKKLIVGTWVPAPGSSTEFMGSSSKSTWTFNSDGTYKEVQEMVFSGSVYTDINTGKYELNTKDGELILTPDDGWHDDTFGDQQYFYKFTVTNDYLTITTGLGTERYNRKT